VIFLDADVMLSIKSKSKAAVWFVSHCGTASRRDELTKLLQAYGVEVDVYGKCGTKSCPKHSSECDEMLNSTYKFYFSYENTLCSDYITEKVFNVMRNFIIPVVFNGAQMKRFLPPKSYVNAENFETVQDLAEHLKFLSENPDEYIKYFWWKKYYDIQPAGGVPVCEICAKVNQFGQHRRQIYDDIFQWFYNGQCRKPKLEL
jgi:alpha-1,3-fucosyltransferase